MSGSIWSQDNAAVRHRTAEDGLSLTISSGLPGTGKLDFGRAVADRITSPLYIVRYIAHFSIFAMLTSEGTAFGVFNS